MDSSFPSKFTSEKAYRESLREEGIGELADDDWFFKGEYKNFSDLNAQRIMPNKGNDGYLYRVFDQHPTQGAKPLGSYWSLTPPKGTEDQWRAGSAVKRQWNEDGKYVKMKIPDEGLPSMTGTVAGQTLGRPPSHNIPGGDQQIYIPRDVVDQQLNKPGSTTTHNSPWNKDGTNDIFTDEGRVWENGD